MFKIAMAAFSSCRPCLGCFLFLKSSSPTADIKDRNSRRPWQKFSRISTLKSSNVPIGSKDLWFCPNAGSLACPVKGHAVMSVKVRPKPKDSGFEAREAPWRESKTAEPSDNMLERSVREASGCNVQ